MITEYAFFASLEGELFAKCLLDAKRALAFGSTAKVYYYIIKSYPFFKNLLEFIKPNYLWFTAKEIENNEISFLTSWLELRSAFMHKCETFPPITFGTALISKEGVEIFSLAGKIQNYLLKEAYETQLIKIPENLQVPERSVLKESPFVDRSEEFLAFNHRCNSAIYIFTPNGKICLAKYEVEGDIRQLVIKDNLLVVYEHVPPNFNNLVIFDLKTLPEPHPINIIPLPPSTLWALSSYICFGEEHLIYIQDRSTNDRQLHALPISSLHSPYLDFSTEWVKRSVVSSYCYILAQDNHFIEVSFKAPYLCDISKIFIQEKKFHTLKIAQDLVVSKRVNAFRKNVCLWNDRLFFAHEDHENMTTISSYDILTNKVKELLFIPKKVCNYPFKSRFLTTAENVYYLTKGQFKCYLTTLTFR